MIPGTEASFYSSFTRRRSITSLFNDCHEESTSSIQQPTTKTKTASSSPSYNSEEGEEMKQKLAWAKHTVLSVAAAIMNVPTDVFTTPPMVDPRPKPSNEEERLHREEINVGFMESFVENFTQCSKKINSCFVLLIVSFFLSFF